MNRIKNGTRVKTTKPGDSTDWSDPNRPDVKWGVEGTIIGHSDSHGLVYDIKHDTGGVGYYEPTEFELQGFTQVQLLDAMNIAEIKELRKRTTFLERLLAKETGDRIHAEDERDSNADTMMRFRAKLRKAENLIKEIGKNFDNSFVETKEGNKYVHGIIKKYLENK